MKTYFIHKSVGRDPRGENPNAQPHWGAGFRLLDFNAWSRAQLRQLDREMSRRFAILSKLAPEWDPFLRELAPEPYVGAPFSYYERFRDPRHLRPKRRHKIQIMGTSGCCALDFFCEESGAVSG